MKIKFITFCRGVLFILAYIGILIIGNIVHESVHYSDVKNQNGTVNYVCFLELPLADNNKWYNRAMGEVSYYGKVESPELRAFSYGLIVMSILTILFCYGFFNKPEEEIENAEM